MIDYNYFCAVSEINMILDTINDIISKLNNETFTACHGRYHTMAVVDIAEHILTSLSCDSRTVELGKIAALLHDIGNIAGRWNHARKSAVLAEVFLDNSNHLLPEEKAMIIQAIDDHSTGTNISSVIGATLLIADKADISKRRILPVTPLDDWHKNLLEIEYVDICISDTAILINHITTESFSKELCINGYKKGYGLQVKASEYLNRTCHIQFNGV